MPTGFWTSTLRPHLSYIASRGRKRIWSDETWLIFAYKLTQKQTDGGWMAIQPGSVQVVLTIRLLVPEDVDELVRVYPPEFRYAMTDTKIRSEICDRLRRKIQGFVAQDPDGAILGAQWCLDGRMSVLNDFAPLAGWRWFEFLNTFVIPKARGKRVAAQLRLGALRSMVNNGYDLAVSLVRIDRHNSMRNNLRFDPKLIGIRSHKTRFGWRKWETTPLAAPK